MSQKKIQLHISRLMAVLLCVTLVLVCIPSVRAEEMSGSCGENLTWSLSAGTLAISGSGAMTDFPESTMAPWYAYRTEILRLELPEGLTTIGNLAFYGCVNLSAAVIPDSVTAIGDFAFTNCEKMRLLTLGSGVKTIGDTAFSDCYSIASLELPEGLTFLGTKAFYRCESITAVTVPGSVTRMGVSVFAYCKNLISVNVQATIQTLPEYTFYGCERLGTVVLPDMTEDISSFSFRGCEQLKTVYYGGSNKSLSEIQTSIGSEVPEFALDGTVTDQKPGNEPVSSGTIFQNPDGSLTQDKITVTPGKSVSVSTKVEYTCQLDGTYVGSNAEITVNISGSDGWGEAKEIIKTELERVEAEAETTHISVYIKGTETVDPGFVEAVAGKSADVTVITGNGSVWQIKTSQMDEENTSGKYHFSYTLSAGNQALCDELKSAYSFVLAFSQPAQVNSEVMIHLGSAWAYQNATLFQRDRRDYTRIQTVVVDQNGYAHFYLAAVDEKTEYCIGMNVVLPEDAQAPIVPEVLRPEYGNIENYQPIQYEITGRTSSWGMNLNQVMGILAAVMVTVIVVVGVVVYAWNKKRLKSGYVPGWDDEEE